MASFRSLKSCLFLILMGSVILSFSAGAQSSSISAKTKKTKASKQIYESENQDKSFTAKVKLMRQIQGDTEVFFDGTQSAGPYALPSTLKDFAILKNRLQKSEKTGGPKVSVSVDDENRILSVEEVHQQEEQKSSTPDPREF